VKQLLRHRQQRPLKETLLLQEQMLQRKEL
jgi:hypothetical protein